MEAKLSQPWQASVSWHSSGHNLMQSRQVCNASLSRQGRDLYGTCQGHDHKQHASGSYMQNIAQMRCQVLQCSVLGESGCSRLLTDCLMFRHYGICWLGLHYTDAASMVLRKRLHGRHFAASPAVASCDIHLPDCMQIVEGPCRL